MDKEKIEEMNRKYEEFLKKFPIEKLEKMNLEEYTNLEKNSFCYWVEFGLRDLGCISSPRGALMYGIYRTDKEPKSDNFNYDGIYAWSSKYGADKASAFKKIQTYIVEIASYAKKEDYKAIDSIDINSLFKWKIAYLYSNRSLVNWFSKAGLVKFAKYFGKSDASSKSKVSELQNFLMGKRNELGLSKEAFSEKLQNIKDNHAELNCQFLIDILKNSRNVILHGAPGTGKTYLAQEIADAMHAESEFVQFHPSYDYTDFVEGLRPVKNTGDSQIAFERRDGVFKTFCTKALSEPTKNFVFIIDEINRGDMSKIFGELFFAIEPGYRGKEKCRGLRTQYANLQKEPNEFDKELDITDVNSYGHFFIPENVYIIGTMNDIDRGVESMDFAFRRRFAFCEIKAENTQEAILCGEDGLSPDVRNDAIACMNSLNAAIAETEGLSSDFQIGAAYFLNLKKLDNDFNSLWDYHLEPLLKEYLRGTEDANSKLEMLKDAYDSPKEE